MNVPVFSHHWAAGSITFPSKVVSVGWNISCTASNSAFASPSSTHRVFGSEAAGLVVVIHRARISPLWRPWMISMIERPGVDLILVCGTPQYFATSFRCCSLVICRIPTSKCESAPTQRFPIAFASPVMDSGPAPGLHRFPVRIERFCRVLFLKTACVEWLYPWNQNVSIAFELPIIRAVSMICFSGNPVINAAFSGEYPFINSFRSDSPLAYFSTFSSSTNPSLRST